MRKSRSSFFLWQLAVLAFFPATQLMAAVIPPIGLAPGSQYQLIFVTAGTTTATSTDINDYNTFVRAEATPLNYLLPPGGTWNVIGSTRTTDAFVNAPSGVNSPWGHLPVYNTHGLEVSDGSGYGIYSPPIGDTVPLLNAIGFDQFGNTSTAGGVNNSDWTGSGADGRSNPSYELGASAANGTVTGNPFSTYPWLGGGAPSAQNPFGLLPLFVLSTPITAIPEPSSILLAAVALVGLVAWRLRRKC